MVASTTHLNSVDIGKVADLAEKIRQEPDAANTKWKADINWKEGFHSETQIREFSPSSCDEPDALGGTDHGPNPAELLLGALGNCLAIGYAANATAAGIKIKDMKIGVEGDLDLHTFMGLRDGHAGFNNIVVEVALDTDASAEQLEALHEKVRTTSPIGHTVSNAIPMSIKAV
ncbi:OsmC family protein [uncultured Roseobacter sp.]|uniref:OsmC family protein n=1 Tax=uncultured Roseobacter sp. TaxID=114847 RepID=UPI002625F1C8|nr:OsmC family protein [uncultured Roseobacter sp.]